MCHCVSRGLDTRYAPMWPTAARGSPQASSFLILTSSNKGYFYCCYLHFFCSTGQKIFQWCLEGEQTLINAEHKPEPRCRGTQTGRSWRPGFPFPRPFKYVGVPRTGAEPEALDLSFPHLTLLTCLQFLFVSLLLLHTAGYEYHHRSFSGLVWLCFLSSWLFSCFPTFPVALRRSHKIHHPFSQIFSKVSSEAISGFKPVHLARSSMG